MPKRFKNFECKCCMWYAGRKCWHLEHTGMKVNACDLCPEFKFIMEDI